MFGMGLGREEGKVGVGGSYNKKIQCVSIQADLDNISDHLHLSKLPCTLDKAMYIHISLPALYPTLFIPI